MRSQRAPPSALLALLLAHLTSANPFPRDALRDAGFGYLMDRACDSYCGTENQLCCSAGQACATLAGTPACTAQDPDGLAKRTGTYEAFTSTWTVTYTSTWSSYIPGATTPAGSGSGGADCVPPEGSGQIACGPICCTSEQWCSDNVNGQCMANEGAGTWTTGTTVGVTVTTAFSAPYRETGTGTTTTATATTTTKTTGTAAGGATSTGTGEAVTTTTSNQLSGGAIAGIVVGTIAGVILLLLLCVCCVIRGMWGGLMALLGLGHKDKRKTERTEIIEERYSRHGSASHSARPSHRTWFSGTGRPSTVAASRKEKKKSSGAGWLAAAAGGALLLLGLRRHDKKKEVRTTTTSYKPSRSDRSSSYYTGTYTGSRSSPSSRSTDRRTHTTRHSRHSRNTRTTRRSSRHTRYSRSRHS